VSIDARAKPISFVADLRRLNERPVTTGLTGQDRFKMFVVVVHTWRRGY
jgi:hypothetical protein